MGGPRAGRSLHCVSPLTLARRGHPLTIPRRRRRLRIMSGSGICCYRTGPGLPRHRRPSPGCFDGLVKGKRREKEGEGKCISHVAYCRYISYGPYGTVATSYVLCNALPPSHTRPGVAPLLIRVHNKTDAGAGAAAVRLEHRDFLPQCSARGGCLIWEGRPILHR